MSKQKIEGKCKCGECFIGKWTGEWVYEGGDEDYVHPKAGQFCPTCGYQLAADGYAYEMVRAERVAELKDEALKLDRALDLACWAIWGGSSLTQKEIRRSLESEARYQLACKEATDEDQH